MHLIFWRPDIFLDQYLFTIPICNIIFGHSLLLFCSNLWRGKLQILLILIITGHGPWYLMMEIVSHVFWEKHIIQVYPSKWRLVVTELTCIFYNIWRFVYGFEANLEDLLSLFFKETVQVGIQVFNFILYFILFVFYLDIY